MTVKGAQSAAHTPSARAIEVDVQYAVESAGVPTERDFERWIEQVLECTHNEHWVSFDLSSISLCIRLVGGEEGLALNQTYRGQDKPTNVLSFSLDESLAQFDLSSARPIGDLVLCAPVVEQEAKAQAKQLDDHYAHLVVHGVLHLLGFDHEEEVAAQDMECKEVAVLRQLGIANPYE